MTSTWRSIITEAAQKRDARWFLDNLPQIPPSLVGCKGALGTIQISPIKSLGMFWIPGARIGQQGLETIDESYADRSAMIVRFKPGCTDSGTYDYMRFSQRECSRLVMVCPGRSGRYKSALEYRTADGVENLTVYIEQLSARSGEPVRARMSSQSQEIVEGVLEDGPITRWLRTHIRRLDPSIDADEIHVLRQTRAYHRPVEEMHNGGFNIDTAYSDGGFVTALSTSTLNAMNASRKEQGKERVIDGEVFRMNIELKGLPPGAEYFIDKIHIHSDRDIPLIFGGLCVRCDVTRVDLQTGDKPDADPLNWLKNNLPPRPDKPSSVTFGVNCAFPPGFIGSIIHYGMRFTVVSEKK